MQLCLGCPVGLRSLCQAHRRSSCGLLPRLRSSQFTGSFEACTIDQLPNTGEQFSHVSSGTIALTNLILPLYNELGYNLIGERCSRSYMNTLIQSSCIRRIVVNKRYKLRFIRSTRGASTFLQNLWSSTRFLRITLLSHKKSVSKSIRCWAPKEGLPECKSIILI